MQRFQVSGHFLSLSSIISFAIPNSISSFLSKLALLWMHNSCHICVFPSYRHIVHLHKHIYLIRATEPESGASKYGVGDFLPTSNLLAKEYGHALSSYYFQISVLFLPNDTFFYLRNVSYIYVAVKSRTNINFRSHDGNFGVSDTERINIKGNYESADIIFYF